MRNFLFLSLVGFLCISCTNNLRVNGVKTEAIKVDANMDANMDANSGVSLDTSYISFLEPYKKAVEKEMALVIGYAPDSMHVSAPECTMLNWATETLWQAAKEVYHGEVDMAVMNMGGMRCEWPAGNITVGNVFELMPFDNILVVLTLRGEDILALCQSFATYGGQGVAGLRMKAIGGKLIEVTIGGKEVDPQKIYTLATSDYLSGGTDHMDALKKHIECWNSDVLIRDLYVEAVKRDTVRAVVDGRMDVE